MKVEEILTLINAGFSKDEILALSKPAEDPKPAEEPKPAEDQKPAEDPKPSSSEFEKINTQLDYLVKRLNLLAVQGIKQPDEPKQETVEDILNGMFKPKEKKGDN